MSGYSRRASGMLMAIAVTAVMVFGSGRAHAQGTSGSFPPPIDSRHLASYGQRLALTADQMMAFESAHGDYLRQFRVLRDGEIAAFLLEQQGMQGGLPERAKIEAYLKEQERLLTQIALLDNRLFDRLSPILAVRQQQVLPRLRLKRERDRYSPSLAVMSFGRNAVDLSELVVKLDLAPEDRVTVDTEMAPYERRLTGLMRQQATATSRMMLDMVDLLAERGYADLDQEKLLEDPKKLQEMMGVMQEIFAIVQEDMGKHSIEMRELNQRTLRKLKMLVPATQFRQVRNAYFREGYQQLGHLVTLAETDWTARALRIDELPAADRAALTAASETFQRRLDELLADGMVVADAFWDSLSPFDMSQERTEKLGTDLGALQEKAEAAAETAISELTAALGSARVETLQRDAAVVGIDRSPEVEAAAEIAAATEEHPFNYDEFVSQPISTADLELYSKQLQLGREMGPVVRTLHEAYREQLIANPVFDELNGARFAHFQTEDDDAKEDASKRTERVALLRRKAIDAMIAADTAFFDDLEAIVGDDRRALLDRVRRSRLRQVRSGTVSGRFSFGRVTSHEAGLDLVSIVLENQPSEDELARLDEILAGYEALAGTAFVERLEAQLAQQRLSDEWMIEFSTSAREDMGEMIQLQLRFREAMKAPQARVRKASETIAALNRTTLEKVLAAMPVDRADEFRRAYELAAFPSIYNDPSALGDRLTRALALTDLTAAQRRTITDLAATYRVEYERLSRAMVEHLSPTPISYIGLDADTQREWQINQQEMAKVRFDRDEVNGRAITRLEMTLDEEQIRRIGGLPERDGEDDLYFFR